MQRSVLLGATVIAAFAAAACGGSSPTTPAAATTPTAAPVASSPAPAGSGPPDVTTVGVASTKLGQILVDGNGRTLYLWEADKSMASSCYGACASAWPPVLTTGTPLAGAGLAFSKLATSARKDGQLEVVYNGHPLYYFIADKKPGDTTGQGLNNFGAAWYVLAPSGTKIDNG